MVAYTKRPDKDTIRPKRTAENMLRFNEASTFYVIITVENCFMQYAKWKHYNLRVYNIVLRSQYLACGLRIYVNTV